MDVVAFYQLLLKPPVPWHVVRADLSVGAIRVDVWLEHDLGVTMACPSCGRPCPVYDHTDERIWRHLDTCESTTWLHARLPRVRCVEHGVAQVHAPMSDGSSRFTMAMECRCIDLAGECSRTGAARLSGLSWDEVDGVMNRAVARGMGCRADKLPSRIGLDEKAVFKRHKYCTVVADLDEGQVVDVLENRKIKDIEPWFESRREQLADVTDVAMDMSAGFANVISRFAPGAAISFDHFHATQLVTKAVDEVRKHEQRDLGKDLRQWFFRSRFLPLYNEENIPEHRREQFDELRRVAVKTSRAWAIKENFRGLWRCTGIEKIKRDAFGFRSKVKLRTAILFHCGGLDLYPSIARA
jgi:transposase